MMIYVHKLVTDDGFIAEFWRRLAEMRRDNPDVTQEDVFYILNDEYREVFKEDRFKSFDAFRKRRDKR